MSQEEQEARKHRVNSDSSSGFTEEARGKRQQVKRKETLSHLQVFKSPWEFKLEEDELF